MRRCAYCGHPCRGTTCRYCADLRRIEREMHEQDQYAAQRMYDDLLEAVQATKGKGT